MRNLSLAAQTENDKEKQQANTQNSPAIRSRSESRNNVSPLAGNNGYKIPEDAELNNSIKRELCLTEGENQLFTAADVTGEWIFSQIKRLKEQCLGVDRSDQPNITLAGCVLKNQQTLKLREEKFKEQENELLTLKTAKTVAIDQEAVNLQESLQAENKHLSEQLAAS